MRAELCGCTDTFSGEKTTIKRGFVIFLPHFLCKYLHKVQLSSFFMLSKFMWFVMAGEGASLIIVRVPVVSLHLFLGDFVIVKPKTKRESMKRVSKEGDESEEEE